MGSAERVPYRVHTVLTDNAFQFTPPRGGWSVGEIQRMLAGQQRFRAHAFALTGNRPHDTPLYYQYG